MNIADKIDADIAKHGRSVICVFPSEGSSAAPNDAFAYTIGNYRHLLPELVFIGSHETGQVLNMLSDIMVKRGMTFHHGELVQLPGAKHPVCLLRANEDIKTDYTCQATYKLGKRKYDVLQVVAPDRNGIFPWEDGCERPCADTMLYGHLRRRDLARFIRQKREKASA